MSIVLELFDTPSQFTRWKSSWRMGRGYIHSQQTTMILQIFPVLLKKIWWILMINFGGVTREFMCLNVTVYEQSEIFMAITRLEFVL